MKMMKKLYLEKMKKTTEYPVIQKKFLLKEV